MKNREHEKKGQYSVYKVGSVYTSDVSVSREWVRNQAMDNRKLGGMMYKVIGQKIQAKTD